MDTVKRKDPPRPTEYSNRR